MTGSLRLQDKVAVVTGAGSSVGKSICHQLLLEGARVVATDVDAEAGGRLAESLRESGEVHFSECDLQSEERIQEMIGDAIMAFGSIHVLVNAATVRIPGDAISVTLDDWRRAFAVNVEAAWLCARYAIPFMKAAQGGAIVNVSSTHAERTMPRRFLHALTRAALPAMSRSMAIDFGPQNVRANTLLLGYIQSDHLERRLKESSDPEGDFHRILSVHPLGRVGTPEDAARAAVFLASDDAAFVTGATLVVDGGRSVVVQDLHNWP
jgi:NAD(P)-dependent dehydrogenase (short-subunit alcohol dehydrogenase family)